MMQEVVERSCSYLNENVDEWYDGKTIIFVFNKTVHNLPEELQLYLKQAEAGFTLDEINSFKCCNKLAYLSMFSEARVLYLDCGQLNIDNLEQISSMKNLRELVLDCELSGDDKRKFESHIHAILPECDIRWGTQ